jgi:hypothetical protein
LSRNGIVHLHEFSPQDQVSNQLRIVSRVNDEVFEDAVVCAFFEFVEQDGLRTNVAEELQQGLDVFTVGVSVLFQPIRDQLEHLKRVQSDDVIF